MTYEKTKMLKKNFKSLNFQEKDSFEKSNVLVNHLFHKILNFLKTPNFQSCLVVNFSYNKILKFDY